ncbi:MAG: porphobilinogen synthase, partial [Bacteroidetes bacterium]|nr:porphobilinogen synthase [Bacteroidota bacterium]
MNSRPRILRRSRAIRSMVAETTIQPSDFISPLFIIEGDSTKEEISSMPGCYRLTVDNALKEVTELHSMGIHAVLLFIKCPDKLKDNEGTEALNPDGLMQRSIRAIKESCPDMLVMTDVALDP